MYAQNPRENASPKQKIPATILLVFSLAGLIAGFAFGGFTGHKAPPTTNAKPTKTPTTIVRATVTVTPDPTPEVIAPGLPEVGKYTYSETADGMTSYTLSAQISDKNTNKPIATTDVQCRLWLTADTDAMKATLTANKQYTLLKNINDLSQPLPGETAGVTFTAPSTELQPCVANGPTTWTYTLAPTIQPGTYYIYVLADWKGIHFNWSVKEIKVTA
jgi:hypothetical protein